MAKSPIEVNADASAILSRMQLSPTHPDYLSESAAKDLLFDLADELDVTPPADVPVLFYSVAIFVCATCALSDRNVAKRIEKPKNAACARRAIH